MSFLPHSTGDHRVPVNHLLPCGGSITPKVGHLLPKDMSVPISGGHDLPNLIGDVRYSTVLLLLLLLLSRFSRVRLCVTP